ncbi:hypothetical protein [Mangrovimonas sp. YM274]|uniref:hypothetical protein n=1 Tax=Mangrovimonas sp. YM274 TaxID=3070660 RepID=UPI0027DC34D9|nr:hypothetical protein [Mangrovimonas sp. YM274]WMI68160.1 hypothetical protein RBH95_13525 [Mangrovimonas sp. YM274]
MIKAKVASILLATFFCVFSYSQEAELLYQRDFSKVSIVFQPAFQTGNLSQNYDHSTYPSLGFKDSFSFQFGFYFNFAQAGNFNFKTGVIAKPFKSYFDINIKNEDLGVSEQMDYSSVLKGLDPLNTYMFSIPFKPEYFLRVNEKLNAVFGLGVNLNLTLGEDDIYMSFNLPSEGGTESNRIFNSVIETTSITLSGELSIGINYDFDFALVQVALFYNDNLFRTAEGWYVIENLQGIENKEGFFDVQGDYYGVSFLLTPKKSWFKRKNDN